MRHHTHGADRAITEYFNSPAFNVPKESELLAAISTEMMRYGRSGTTKAIIASAIARLEGEVDESKLQDYRILLTQLLDEKKAGPLR